MLLRYLVALCAVLLLASCDLARDLLYECKCSPDTLQRMQATAKLLNVQTLSVSSKPIVCKAGERCEIEVPVWNYEEGDPKDPTKKITRCAAKLDYCTLCVRGAKNSGSTPTLLVWKLKGDQGASAADFEFAANRGIDIFSATVTGKRDFVNPGHENKVKQTYKWEAGPDVSGMLGHDARIYRRQTAEQCPVVDPDAINTN